MAKKPMTCPDDGVTMNHHAEKLVDPIGRDQAQIDPALGGVIEEIHTCPKCGKARFRVVLTMN